MLWERRQVIFFHGGLEAEGVQPRCKVLGLMEPQPQPAGHLREVETAFCNQRVHHSVHDGDHDNDQDGIHSLQMKWRWTVTIGSKVTLISESSLIIFSYLHLIRLNVKKSLKTEGGGVSLVSAHR